VLYFAKEPDKTTVLNLCGKSVTHEEGRRKKEEGRRKKEEKYYRHFL
jgi:hypothetical protein